MSGKTARRARKAKGSKKAPRYKTYDAKLIYANLMLEMMAAQGISERTHSKEEIDDTIKACCDVFNDVYDEYLVDVLYDGDRDTAEAEAELAVVTGTPIW